MTTVQAPNAANNAADKVLEGFIVPDRVDVLGLIGRNACLLPILRAAPDHVARAFGTRLPLRLRVFRDREGPECAELLVEILVGAGTSWDAADRNLLRLHEQWLATVPRAVSAQIQFLTEPE
jgi:hypothetical protein